MKSGKLLTLAGLGASATAAIAAPVYGFSNDTPRPILTPRNTNPFSPITGNTPSLYQECTKKTFDTLHNPEAIKGEISGSIEASKIQLPVYVGGGVGDGCLRVDIRHQEDSAGKKGNVVANIELAVSRGNYGFILLNSITNLGWFSFDYRALFLEKVSQKWTIKSGIQWQDKLFMEGSKPEKIKWKLPNQTIEETYWRNMLCDPHMDCEKQLQGQPKVNKKYEFDWPKSPSKNVYQALEIQNPSTSSPYESDFWNGKESPLLPNSNIVNRPLAVFVDGQWSTTTKLFGGNIKQLQDWFNRFKSEKGVWNPK